MAEVEKLIPEIPRESTPEGGKGVPAKAETVESKPTVPEVVQPVPERVVEPVPAPTPVAIPTAPVRHAPTKDELTKEIEDVLAEDLGDIYKNLPPEKQQKFKEEGEKTATMIKQMIETGKFHGRKLVHMIIRWLKLIPGVNKFFLEQESKIKADKLIEIAEEQKRK
jgi:hypothetical protein